MKSKKGVMGEGILMIYRLVLVSFIAFVVLGVSSIFYNYYVDVRDAESWLLARQVSDCLNPQGEINLSLIDPSNEGKILDYCGITQNERFYVGIEIFEGNKKIKDFYQGDSGSLWQVDLYNTHKGISAEIGKYRPGHYRFEYPVILNNDDRRAEGVLKMEVLVTHEF